MRHPLLVLVVLSGLPLMAHAQDYPDDEMSTLRFRPAAGRGNFLLVDGAHVPEHLAYSLGLWLEAGGPTLQQQGAACTVDNAPCTDEREREHLDSIPFAGFGHLSASLALFERAQLALDVPVGGNSSKEFFTSIRTDDGASSVSDRPADGFALGDPRVHGKVHLVGEPEDRLSAAVAAHVTLPLARATGRRHYVGERTVQAGGYLIGEYAIPRFRMALNVGGLYRPHATYLSASTGSELTYGIAGQAIATSRLAFTLEVNGSAVLVGDGDHPAEALLGMSVGKWDWRFPFGGGVGFTDAPGTPSGRGFLALVYSPDSYDGDGDGIDDRDDACVTEAEDADGFEDDDGCPELDNDGDGVEDASDECPMDAEDPDGFEDDDGCPELDNDGDGVQDGYDSCPHEKEDLDGDRDSDGCPDFDTDRDGVVDAEDACPNEPEDTDGLGDEDGCPDADFDGDGIDDEQDSCPEQPELFNGIEDDDGCPEPDQDRDGVADAVDRCPGRTETLNGGADSDGCPDGPARLALQGRRLLPTAPLIFEDARLIQPRSFRTLDVAVQLVERQHRGGKVAVVVYAPDSDTEAAARGESVRDYLAEHGLPSERTYVEHVAGEPPRIELHLVGPNAKPRPKP